MSFSTKRTDVVIPIPIFINSNPGFSIVLSLKEVHKNISSFKNVVMNKVLSGAAREKKVQYNVSTPLSQQRVFFRAPVLI